MSAVFVFYTNFGLGSNISL